MKGLFSVLMGLLVTVFVFGQAEAGLVSYWSFDDDILPPDDVASDSADGNKGEINDVNGGWYYGDGIEQVAGISGSAMRLIDGTAYMDVWPATNLDPGTGDFSISLWIRKPLGVGLEDWSGEEYLVTYGPGVGAPHYAVYIWNNRLWASMSTDNDRPSVAVAGLLNDGNWHHVVAVRYSATNILYQNRLYFYVDGVYRDWWTATGWDLVGQHLRIGTYGGGLSSGQWHGDIDEVKYYNQALTAAQVWQSYLGNPPELIPEANAGPDQLNVEATGPAGALINLNGSGSALGFNANHLHYYWTTDNGSITEDGVNVDDAETAGAVLALGVGPTATVTLTVKNADASHVEGNSDTDTLNASVVDSTVPVVEITKPVNGEESPSAAIQVHVRVKDNTATTVSISMNEQVVTLSAPDEDGYMTAQTKLIQPKEEIDITAVAVDAGGNEGSDTVTTIKVHDQRK